MRKNYWFRVCACGTCSLAILGADAVGIRWSASAVEPRMEQYITLDDGLYALQADGTYSKVEGKRPQPHTHTHSGNHVHDHGTAVRPSGGGAQQNGKYLRLDDGLYALQADGTYSKVEGKRPQSDTHTQSGNHVHDHGTSVRPSGGGAQQNAKYLRLDDGLYVLQSDGTYMRAQDVPRPVSPGNRPNSNNQQVWQDDGWDDDGNGWNQPQWQNDGRRPQPRPRPQPQWVENRPVRPNRPSNNQDVSDLMVEGQQHKSGRRPQPQWTDNRPVRPNRPSNDQDVSGLMDEGQSAHADDGRSDLEKLGEFLDAIIQ